MRRRGEPYYGTAQICLNGHEITSDTELNPEQMQKHCSDCGTLTIMECPSCSARIRGYYHIPGVLPFPYSPPSFCHECGQPYPWTQERLKAAEELIDLSDVGESDKEALKRDLPALTTESPRTQVAATRFSIFLKKTKTEVGSALRQILVEVATEAAKKTIFPGT